MKRLVMLIMAGILLVPAITSAAVDGFDYPVGKPDGVGYYVCQDHNECVNASCNPIACTGSPHLGEDWNRGSQNTDCGDPVFAVANGTVYMPGNYGSCWANVVFVRHEMPDGSMVEAMYGHLSAIESGITHGQTVVRGQKLGEIGGSGLTCSQYCHLHFEMRLENCPYWGVPGPGYYPNPTGWVDPSDFIDANRSVTPAYRSTWHSNSAPQTGEPGDILTGLFVKYTNTGTEYWENTTGVTNPRYVDLRSVDASGNVIDCPFTPVGWINPQRVKAIDTSPVNPGGVATFTFSMQIPNGTPLGDYNIWFRPAHGGTLMDDWGGVNILVHVVGPGGPCPGRQIPNACVPSSTCYPAQSPQTLPDMSSKQWSAPGMPIQDVLQTGQEYSLNFEYRSESEQQLKLGLGSFNPMAKQLGSEVGSTTLPTSFGWKIFWSAPFTLTAEQLRDYPNLRLLAAQPDGIEIRNVRILQTSK